MDNRSGSGSLSAKRLLPTASGLAGLGWKKRLNFKEFESQVALSTEEICRKIFQGRSNSITIKKEDVAVRNLVKIFNATLKLANRKSFHAMSLRDLRGESGLSLGGLYAYFKNKEELLTLIQEQGRAIVLPGDGQSTSRH